MTVAAVEAVPAVEGAVAEGSTARAATATAKPKPAKPLGSTRASSPDSGSAKQQSRTPLKYAGGPARHKGKKTSWGDAFGSLSGKSDGGPLLAEYIAAIVIIFLGTLTRGPGKGYSAVMSELMLRLTAVTTVFFILFLFAGTKGGKAAVWFGLLIDLGIIYTASSQDVIVNLTSALKGQPTGVDDATLISNTDVPEPKPPVILPSDADTTGTQTV